jgi:hypothetical protein
MDTSSNNSLTNQILLKIAQENKDIISYYFDEENQLINLFYEKRSIKRTGFGGTNQVLKSSYRTELDKIISFAASQHDFNLFLILFRVIVERYSIRRLEILKSQEKKKKNTKNNDKNSTVITESTLDNSSLQTSMISTRKNKIIIEDDEEEEFEQAPNLQNIFAEGI